jgi:hypothetical protein
MRSGKTITNLVAGNGRNGEKMEKEEKEGYIVIAITCTPLWLLLWAIITSLLQTW